MFTNHITYFKRAGIFPILLMSLGVAQAERLAGGISYILPSGSLSGVNGEDLDNTGTNTQSTICWDNPAISANCNTVTMSGTGHSVPSSFTVHNIVPTFNPDDGAQHYLYERIISPTNPGVSDTMADGSPFPYRYITSTSSIAPAWTANLETTPGRLTKAQGQIFINSADVKSTGTSAGTQVCLVGSTHIYNNGFAGSYVSQYGFPCANLSVLTLPTTATITEAQYNSLIEPTRAGLSSSIQWIGLAFAAPAQVISSTAGATYPNTLSYVLSQGGVLYTGPTSVPSGTIVTTHTSGSGGQTGVVGIWHDWANPLFNSTTKAPFADYGLRYVIHLVAAICGSCVSTANNSTWTPDVGAYQSVIARSFGANDTNPTGGTAYWAYTSDTTRSIMALTVTNGSLGTNLSPHISGTVLGSSGSPTSKTVSATNIMMYVNGADNFGGSGAESFMAGSIAYHATSFGGQLPSGGGQAMSFWWLNDGSTASGSGAAATAGEYLEPGTNMNQKLPVLEIMAPLYSQGQSAIEVLWKATRFPQNTVFIGDPLASPFSLPSAVVPTTYIVSSFPVFWPAAVREGTKLLARLF